ncbi:hypothetical protein B0I35DRAFT_412783 [Stachybotrys elegans]|uniref:Uncharacterized protein n=1 Tax=Stachybotrys elegans TaxID=80388 RepID=A0A8K0SG01_9HYPO|nr:hypothetical protein B0I35DRAFT_412783 [Stachybotrys elegans]
MPADNRRKLLQRRLNKLKQQQGQEALVEKVNEALAKDDQSLEAIPEQEWQAMNIDGPDEEERGDSAGVSSTSPAGSSHAESSGTAGENADGTKGKGVNEDKKNQDEAGKNDNKKRKDEKNKRRKRDQSIRPSIESDDDGDSSLFISDGDSDSDSVTDAYSDDEAFLNSDPDLGKSLYTFPAAKASKSGETVGWTGRGTRWGVKEADELIFKAAQKAQDRYEENQTDDGFDKFWTTKYKK